MDLQDWWPWYEKIVRLFGYDKARDQGAADLLSKLLNEKAIHVCELSQKIRGKQTMVFGAGPSLESDLRALRKEGAWDSFVTITADGATSAFLKVLGHNPDIIVTDLDGVFKDLLSAHKMGSIMVIHAHGDNIARLKRCIPKIERALGTTQGAPKPNVYNFGGFTDGDRAVCLAEALGAKLIVLAGMDFGTTVGKYSKRRVKSMDVKRMKLKVGKEILEFLAGRTSAKLFNITSSGERLAGFETINLRDLRALLRF